MVYWLYTWFPALFALGMLALVGLLLLLAWISGAGEENQAIDRHWERDY